MKTIRPTSPYVTLIKTVLKENDFRCRANICSPKEVGELDVEIAFRNQWGRPLHDVGLLVKDKDIGWLLVADLYPTFQGFVDLFQDFTEDELRNLHRNAGERIRSTLLEEIIPFIRSLTRRAEFLQSLNTGQFSKFGLFMPAVGKLRAKYNL
jgi:hypothetical protein